MGEKVRVLYVIDIMAEKEGKIAGSTYVLIPLKALTNKAETFEKLTEKIVIKIQFGKICTRLLWFYH